MWSHSYRSKTRAEPERSETRVTWRYADTHASNGETCASRVETRVPRASENLVLFFARQCLGWRSQERVKRYERCTRRIGWWQALIFWVTDGDRPVYLVVVYSASVSFVDSWNPLDRKTPPIWWMLSSRLCRRNEEVLLQVVSFGVYIYIYIYREMCALNSKAVSEGMRDISIWYINIWSFLSDQSAYVFFFDTKLCSWDTWIFLDCIKCFIIISLVKNIYINCILKKKKYI